MKASAECPSIQAHVPITRRNPPIEGLGTYIMSVPAPLLILRTGTLLLHETTPSDAYFNLNIQRVRNQNTNRNHFIVGILVYEPNWL